MEEQSRRDTHAFFDADSDQIEEMRDPFFDVVGRLAFAHVPGTCPHVERLGVSGKESKRKRMYRLCRLSDCEEATG